MKWNLLSSEEQLNEIIELSKSKAVIVFKHSTRCSISSAALSRFERFWKTEFEQEVIPFYLDLIAYRSVSHDVADLFNVQHESPQILLIKDGKCVFTQSHMGINLSEILTHSH